MNSDILKGVAAVLSEVMEERKRQEQRHPGDTCWELGKDKWDKLAVLDGEVTEVFNALYDEEPIANLRAELIQVAAVAVAWVQALDRAEVMAR